jgi:hypothetical protein
VTWDLGAPEEATPSSKALMRASSATTAFTIAPRRHGDLVCLHSAPERSRSREYVTQRTFCRFPHLIRVNEYRHRLSSSGCVKAVYAFSCGITLLVALWQ